MSTPSSMVGRAEEERQVAVPKPRLAILAVVRGHLGGVLARSSTHSRSAKPAVALDEVAIDLCGKPALVEEAGPLDRAVFAVAGEPAQGVGVELVAGIVTGSAVARRAAATAAPNLLDDAVALQREEQEPDGLVGLRPPEGLSGWQARGEGAPEVLSVGPVGRDEEAPSFSPPAGTRPGDDGGRKLAFVVQVPRRAFEEARLRLLDEIMLLRGSRTSTFTASARRMTSRRVRVTSSRTSPGRGEAYPGPGRIAPVRGVRHDLRGGRLHGLLRDPRAR